MNVRSVFLTGLFLWLAVSLQAGPAVPEPLATALGKFVAAEAEWAYTQVYRRADKPHAQTVARFDPSRPREHQWELVLLRGRKPSSDEASRWCKRRMQEDVSNDAEAMVQALDLEKARFFDESPDRVRYAVPLRKQTIKRVPTENFIVIAEVDRRTETLRRLSASLTDEIRILGGMAKIDTAEGEVVFQALEGGSAARPVYISARGTGSALFKRVQRSAEILFVDQRRVKS
jgi:hypothetical protein